MMADFSLRRIFVGAKPPPQPAAASDDHQNPLQFASPNPRETSASQGKDDSYFSTQGFPRISRPVELLRPAYDVVVVGSGYGGGVAASRMARGGQSVCLLELGREKWPGEYPTTAVEAAPEFQVTGTFTPFDTNSRYMRRGDAQGLYHLVLGQGQNAFVGHGLGGTSLLNANVFLEADQKTLGMRVWPESVRKDDSLRRHYNRARDMLQPETYPEDFPHLPKLDLLKKQADAIGQSHQFYRVPQTTRFESGHNHVGVEMNASTLTGMDATGINDGSKSSTLVNYLADAWNWGTEIFCGCEVRYIKKHPTKDGYLVFFAWHGSKRGEFKDNFHSDLMWVYAKRFVFLGAGALGTTEILLRSKGLGLRMSEKVGTHMSGNGDILAFGYNTDVNVNAMGKAIPNPGKPVGPTVTGVIDCRDQPNPLDGFVIEEGTVPAALVRGLQGMLTSTPGKVHPTNRGFLERSQKILAASRSTILGPYTSNGSMENTQVYLVMSHDSNQAILSLSDDKPVLRFLGVGRSEHVRYLNTLLAKATNAVGGTFVNNPFFAAFGEQEITVHPIGGANMSRDGCGEFGVTTEFGELLSGNGLDIHDGIVVVDGAVIPCALGVNPLATITALAERSVEAVAQKYGVVIDYETKNGTLDLFGPPSKYLPVANETYRRALTLIKAAQAASKEGIEFAEIMSGYMYLGSDIEDYVIAANAAKGSCSSARLFLSVRSWDTDSLISLQDHRAMLTGIFICGSLPGSPFLVLRGDFQLFRTDSCTPDTVDITYDFDMISAQGDCFHFHGRKMVDPSVTFSPRKMWNATSTLYVTITKPGDNVTIGRGILQLESRKFVSQLETLTGTGKTWMSRASSTVKFLTYFSTQLAHAFFAPFSRLQWPQPTPRRFKYQKQPPSRTVELIAFDDVPTVMNIWDPVVTKDHDDKDMPVGTPVLMVCGASVTDDIFALPTLETNAVEFFTRSGFRVYTLTPRFGITPVAQRGFTAFDARLDVHAALAKVRTLQESSKPIYVVAHCVGALAFSMGLLDGTIPASWVAGITASQVFIHPNPGRVNQLKALLPLTQMYDKLLGSWYSCSSSPSDNILQQMLNQSLRFYPVGATKEICSSIVCRRSELIFGRLWCHHNLNEETHTNLATFLGGISMRTLSHLVEMSRRGYVMNNEAESLVTEVNLDRLRGIPILFFSGAENVVFSPISTETSYSKLQGLFVDGDYDRVEFAGRGHLDCWMGTNAVRDIYPTVRAHARRYGR